MKRLLVSLVLAVALPAAAQDLLIRDATVHTVGARGTLKNHDVLVQGGVIRQIGSGLVAPAGVTVVEAKGRPLTPGLFGGLTGLGIEEVSGEASTVDNGLALSASANAHEHTWRPEFDVDVAFNPRSVAIAVNRVEGITFTVLSPSSNAGGSFVAGQGSAVVLDGRFDAALPNSRSLFVNIGGGASQLSGGSRAGQWMLLEQAIAEARTGSEVGGLLTRAGRSSLARYLAGGRVVFQVDRAADIRQVLAFAKKHGIKPVIAGGAEAWMVAPELKAANVPVLLDALVNLPSSFDALGSTLDNAARLHRAGVSVGFSQSGDATHNARKVRQLAGVAVANGLPWEAGLAGLTAVPAQVFGLSPQRGRIDVGQVADLVLWSGDPLEVNTVAEQVWFDGRAASMRSRQTELRDRYLKAPGPLPRAYSGR
ncbi:amidohydrolase family protein [Arenimonas alkanexedens]